MLHFIWFPGIFGPLAGLKISGNFTAIEGGRAKPRLVKVPDMPIG